ncbi:MAG: cache domain-containing protein [Candidatus Bathyarchaeota archaeon]
MPLRIRTGALWSIAIGLALIAGIWTAIYLQDSRDDQNDRRIAEMSATNLATVFEAHVSDIFTAIDRVILYSREEYAANGYINERFRDHLFSRVFPGSLVQISVLDRDGRLAYSSRSEPGVGKQDFSSAEYFAHQRDAGDDHLYISKPVQDAITGKWIVQCVRKLRDRGEFAGVVVFSMDAMSFVDMHSSLDVGKEGAITLLGMDGVIRARLSDGGTGANFSASSCRAAVPSSIRASRRAASTSPRAPLTA